MPVCIHVLECGAEEDKAEEEEYISEESEKGDGSSSHSGRLFSSKMYFQSFIISAVHDLHKDNGGGIGCKRNASQRVTSFHVPRMCSCLHLS